MADEAPLKDFFPVDVHFSLAKDFWQQLGGPSQGPDYDSHHPPGSTEKEGMVREISGGGGGRQCLQCT